MKHFLNGCPNLLWCNFSSVWWCSESNILHHSDDIFQRFTMLSLLILNRSPCTYIMRIVGCWCYTSCTDSKDTLDSVPILLIVLICTHYCCPNSGIPPFWSPSFTPAFHPRLSPLTPSPSHLPQPGQFPHVPTKSSLPIPPDYSLPHCTGTELVVSQYTARSYSAFAKCRFLSDRTLPPLLSPPPSCTPIYCQTSSMTAFPSVSVPPGLGNSPVPIPCGG